MKRKQSLLTAGCWSCAGAWPQNMCSTSTTSQTLQLLHWQVNQLSLFANCMRRLVQGNQALLIIRQVLALVELWELELPSVFHFFTGIIILSPTQLLSRSITKRFNQHISGWNLLTDFYCKHFGVTFFLLVYLSILLLLDNGVVRLAGLHKFCWSNMESHSPRWTLPYQRGVDIVYPT